MNFQDTFEKSLKKLDLQGIILLQGLLAQRALELMSLPTKEDKKSSIIQANTALAL